MYRYQGEKLKEFRISKSYSLSKVGSIIGVSANYLSLIERGLRKPSEVVLYSLSEVYKTKPIELFSLYKIVPSEQIERIISSPSLVKILSALDEDEHFTNQEKELVSKAIEEEVFKILKSKRGNNL